MGILSDMFHKIFPAGHPAIAAAENTGATAAGATTNTTAAAAPNAGAQATPMPPVDINAVLTQKASQTPEKLNWQTSIVDLMKLLGLDSSLDHRKQLAKELDYTGDSNDSATMNIWLHKQVMARIAANGGQVPAGLK